ncbi:unnamed protein product [Heligmosomoides polygyrus]|uniref:Uncharacterized protein n=1 Tax=Heligmosomoides polygyrus TaxID=6339 RepID=A0A183G6Y1_HELPZ|nr:unnamed protein product [Heligmosomoides polygyrus]
MVEVTRFTQSCHRLDSARCHENTGTTTNALVGVLRESRRTDMTLFVHLERGGSIGALLHATVTNGDAAGACSSKSMINETAPDTSDAYAQQVIQVTGECEVLFSWTLCGCAVPT